MPVTDRGLFRDRGFKRRLYKETAGEGNMFGMNRTIAWEWNMYVCKKIVMGDGKKTFGRGWGFPLLPQGGRRVVCLYMLGKWLEAQNNYKIFPTNACHTANLQHINHLTSKKKKIFYCQIFFLLLLLLLTCLTLTAPSSLCACLSTSHAFYSTEDCLRAMLHRFCHDGPSVDPAYLPVWLCLIESVVM